MKLALLASVLLAAPALAQPPSPKTDWTKPVIGVDGPDTLNRNRVEEVTIPIEVFTLEDATGGADPAEIRKFIQSLADTPVPPPCEPPVTKAPAAKPPPPAPCPAPPR